MTEALSVAERQARRWLERKDTFLDDKRLTRFARLMAEQATTIAQALLNAVELGDEAEVWRLRGLMVERQAHLVQFTPKALSGRRFTDKKDTRAAVRGRGKKAEGRESQLGSWAGKPENKIRKPNGKINASEMAWKFIDTFSLERVKGQSHRTIRRRIAKLIK